MIIAGQEKRHGKARQEIIIIIIMQQQTDR
jgi:hypothetical protein